jgi:hypothetical protein
MPHPTADNDVIGPAQSHNNMGKGNYPEAVHNARCGWACCGMSRLTDAYCCTYVTADDRESARFRLNETAEAIAHVVPRDPEPLLTS